MSAPELRTYQVSLVGHGEFAVWVTAESRRSACDVAERMWNESRSAVPRNKSSCLANAASGPPPLYRRRLHAGNQPAS